MKYQRKPEIVDAVQWFKMGDHEEVVQFRKTRGLFSTEGFGLVEIRPGDWIVEYVSGHSRRYNNKDFHDLYEKVEN